MLNPLIILSFLVFGLGIRTFLWHLQNWQIREYRFDRLRAYFQTQEGIKNVFNLWFFKGLLPRPKITGRIFMIVEFFLLFHLCAFILFWNTNLLGSFSPLKIFFWTLFWERTLFVFVALAVFFSKIPVFFAQKILFQNAQKIIQKADKNIVRIGITGSFGKSSTKEILIHLLQQEFGKENILFNPENQNNEVAIARLVLKNEKFFQQKEEKRKKYFVCEIGAYKRGEIKKVCDFLSPHIGIMTGLNAQHISLFGSQKNIQKAKFELAETTKEKVFFNADNVLLNEIFEDKKINATPIPLSTKSLEIETFPEKSEFNLYGQKFTLPWAGSFFVQNAVLALECARELGINRKKLPALLKSIAPLERALKVEKFGEATLLKDLYSANPDGVKTAITHLENFKGKRIFIGMPLLELGNKSQNIHQKIFEQLKDINAEVFWLKPDYKSLGKEICKQRFHYHKQEKERLKSIKKTIKNLSKNDVILLESKLPKEILNLFQIK